MPLSTSATVVGFTNAPAFTTKDKRPALKISTNGEIALLTPKLCPKYMPESACNASFFTAILDLAFS